MGDHFYMTQYYYDLLANVGLDKQVAISGVKTPIVNYFTGDKVVLARDKYEVVEDINRTSMSDCGKKIYIEFA